MTPQDIADFQMGCQQKIQQAFSGQETAQGRTSSRVQERVARELQNMLDSDCEEPLMQSELLPPI